MSKDRYILISYNYLSYNKNFNINCFELASRRLQVNSTLRHTKSPPRLTTRVRVDMLANRWNPMPGRYIGPVRWLSMLANIHSSNTKLVIANKNHCLRKLDILYWIK